ncbi:hypothetical protein E6C64_00350 [Naasia lichenicola]|uniref:Uncharacterized protein n=2 Tax=Naasia lichenicola TaxID=2565933 RepID=A0A4V3WTQ3_9MICO|nr:hypothetical protein E6C64_00350 [Naasia lichenicola]
MAITRAVSLAEVTLARMAAAWVGPAHHYVFPMGNLWSRQWEALFYRTVLVKPFLMSANGFSAARDLRDLYTHGYGVPATEERRSQVAQSLYSNFSSSSATPEEHALGFDGEAYFFGQFARFDPKAGRIVTYLGMSKRAEVSKLAAHRVMRQIAIHIHAAHASFEAGLRTDLSSTGNKFVRTATRWWERRSQPD